MTAVSTVKPPVGWERYENVWRGTGLAVLVFAIMQGITPIFFANESGSSAGPYYLLLTSLGLLAIGGYLAASSPTRFRSCD